MDADKLIFFQMSSLIGSNLLIKVKQSSFINATLEEIKENFIVRIVSKTLLCLKQ